MQTVQGAAEAVAQQPISFADRFLSLVSPPAAFRHALSLSKRGEIAKAFPLLVRAAKAGIADAQYSVARCYLGGQGVPGSTIEGARWLLRAAESGHIEAQAQFAALCAHGLAGANSNAGPQASGSLFETNKPSLPDFATAQIWARKAADAGSPSGQAILAYILTWAPDPMRDLEQAHRLYVQSAKANCPEGCLGYALALSQSARSEDELREVARNIRVAADGGLTSAIYLLAVLTERGSGVTKDSAGAAELFHQAAERGLRDAQFRWGKILVDGIDIPANPIEGERWLRKAALAGDIDAAALVGDLCVKNQKPPNYIEAVNWYRLAAEAGHKEAARALGSLYLTGAGVAEDKEEAARWLRLAAETGDEKAQVDFANVLLSGAGDAQDAVAVAHWFEQAAIAGNEVAAFNYGLCLANGMGVDRDEEQAARWLERAANGVPNAQYMYGRMLAEGRGLPADLVAARAWYKKAADANFPDAQVALAEMLINGRGGEEDPAKALELFEKAAAKGHSGAMFALGALYSGSHQLEADAQEAQRWMRAAAEKDHGYAQMMLGRYLAVGAAGSPDPIEARRWLEKAVAQGIEEARPDLDALPQPEDAST